MNQKINSVVLPCFSRLRVTTNHRRPVDRDRQISFNGIDFQLGEILRLLVIVAITRLVSQLRLQNHSLALSSNVTRRDVMKLFQAPQRTRQFDDIPRAADVDAQSNILGNGEIVNSGEMKDARSLLLDQLQIRGAQSKLWFRDIAFDDLKLSNTPAGERRDSIDLFMRARRQRRLHEENEITLLPRQTLQKPVRNKARKARYEECLSIRHRRR